MRVYFPSFVVVLTAIFLTAPSAWSATYQRTDDVVLDIFSYSGIQQGIFLPHYYSGPNLEPFAGLSGAFLQDAALPQADFTVANLISTVLSYCSLEGADLSFALLIDADSSFSSLQDADLTSAIATRIDLRNADRLRAELGSTNLTDADLRKANLYGASVIDTVWTGALYDENTIFPDGADIYDGWP